MSEINPDIEQLNQLRELSASLEAFLASPLHDFYVKSAEKEIADIDAAILLLEPNTPNDMIELLKLYGMKRAAAPLPFRFKETHDSLNARITSVERDTTKS